MPFKQRLSKLWESLWDLDLKLFCTHHWDYPVLYPGFCVEGVWRIHNETPIRQKRPYVHYGVSFDLVLSWFGLPAGLPFAQTRLCIDCARKERFLKFDRAGRMLWVKVN